jgi:phosphoadenosine phosphosulfate reductase
VYGGEEVNDKPYQKPWQTPMFDPSEEDMYQFAITRPLEKKIAQAIAIIQEYEPKAMELSPDGYYVAFSGGKDSIVLLDLFRRAGVKHKAYYNNTTIDPPELVRFIRKNYADVAWNNPEIGLISIVEKWGYPTQKVRWCCEIFKEHGGEGLFKSIGVRGPESPRRKGLWRVLNNHTKNNSPILCPIVYWTDDDIWNYIRQNNMAYCELYDQGFKRLGCVGCPMGNQHRDFERWPRYEAAWKKAGKKHFDNFKGTKTKRGLDRWIDKFQTFDDFWNQWIRNDDKKDGADCQLWLW